MFYWSDCGWSEYLKITKQKKKQQMFAVLWVADFSGGGGA